MELRECETWGTRLFGQNTKHNSPNTDAFIFLYYMWGVTVYCKTGDGKALEYASELSIYTSKHL